jgi:hypothetical protein
MSCTYGSKVYLSNTVQNEKILELSNLVKLMASWVNTELLFVCWCINPIRRMKVNALFSPAYERVNIPAQLLPHIFSQNEKQYRPRNFSPAALKKIIDSCHVDLMNEVGIHQFSHCLISFHFVKYSSRP